MSTLYCPECGYNLTGLTENRCPECGEGFDPKKLEELYTQYKSVRTLLLMLLIVPVCLVVVGLLVFLLNEIYPERAFSILAMGTFILAMVATIFLHSLYVSVRLGETIEVFRGRKNTPWYISLILPCWILFVVAELGLTLIMLVIAFIFLMFLFN